VKGRSWIVSVLSLEGLTVGALRGRGREKA
jgi:hypothetical protein